MRRTIRTNKWHAVRVSVEPNWPTDDRRELEIRLNSDPGHLSSSAYLTPTKAREVAAALIEAAKTVEASES